MNIENEIAISVSEQMHNCVENTNKIFIEILSTKLMNWAAETYLTKINKINEIAPKDFINNMCNLNIRYVTKANYNGMVSATLFISMKN